MIEFIMSEKPVILILDDLSAYVRALERVLRTEYEVRCALSIKEAEGMVEGAFAALVDIRLKEKETDNRDGLVFIQWLSENYPDTISIAMSALEDPGLDREALTAGARTFLAKPVRISALRELLANFARVTNEKK